MDEKKTYLVNIESNLQKYAEEAAAVKKKVDELKASNDELIKSGKNSGTEWEANRAALKNANAEYTKAQKMVQLQVAANSSERGSRKQLSEILTLQMQALGKLGNAYVVNAKGVRELNPLYIEQRKRIAETKQAIIDYDLALNDGRSNIGRYGESIKIAMNQTGSALGEVGNAIGGVVGQVSDMVSSFLIAGGVVGVLKAAVGLLAKAWKTTRDNIELYLKSADKLAIGSAGYQVDAKKAMEDLRKRAAGQIAEGMRISGDAQNYLLRNAKILTEEQKKYYEGLVESGKKMMIDGMKIQNIELGRFRDRHKWEMEYTALLQEQEAIGDMRLAKETEWEALEVNLVKQRSIVSDQESTTLQRKIATIEADKISKQLGKEKTELVDRELANVMALSLMTKTEDAQKEKINGLLKEKNTIQKEYYADQIKINKLDKISAKDKEAELKALQKMYKDIEDSTAKAWGNAKKMRDDFLKDANKSQADKNKDTRSGLLGKTDTRELNESDKKRTDNLKALSEYNKLKNKGNLDALTTDLTNEYNAMKLSTDYALMGKEQRLLIDQQYTDATNALSQMRLQQKMNEVSTFANLAGAMSNILGQQSEAGKAFAVAEAIMNTYTGATMALRDPTVPSTVLRIASAAAVILNGMAQVKQILAVNTGGSSKSVPTSITSTPAAQRVLAPPAGASVINQSSLSQQQLGAITEQKSLTADDIAKAVAQLPAPIVTVEDINVRSNQVKKVSVRANI